MTKSGLNLESTSAPRIFYGWWIVAASFLNLFFTTGIIYYGFPVFYPAFVASLGFTRAQVTQGFLVGTLVVGLPFGLLAGAVIDRIGARSVILSGVAFIGLPLVLMGWMTRLWQYELLCIVEILGYTLAGPIPNQVLIAQWFVAKRGRAMGYAYLGLGLGGLVAPPTANLLIKAFGWRHALEMIGSLILIVLFPVGIFITRSAPAEMGLAPDGLSSAYKSGRGREDAASSSVSAAVRSANFWLILVGATLILGAVNAVIQHFILFMKDQGYSITTASRFLSILLASSLAGRVLVGYFADRFKKKNTMALSYLLLSAAIPLLWIAHRPMAALAFVVIFGFSMGADYMLIPLVTAECFGTASLGKLLALIIMGYSIGQWVAPWIAGKMFDTYHSYTLTWSVFAVGGVLGAAAIYCIRPRSREARSALYLLLLLLVLPLPLLGQNPQAAPSTLLHDGRTVYVSNCSGCHGSDTNGTDHAPKLSGNADVRSRSVEQLRSLIVSGIPAGGMPAFALPAHQLDAVAAYVHSLNSPASVPSVAGDATVGARFFWGEGNCGSCHMVQGRGSSKGPDLSDVGRRLTAQEITSALLQPDQHITAGYALVTVTLRNGQTVRGFARGRTNFNVQLQDLDGAFHLFESRDILSIADDPHSLMKPVSAQADQIQDLTAYLNQLKGIEPGPLKEHNAQYVAQVQDIDFSRILDPKPGDWPTYNGQLNGNRYSALNQINGSNVQGLVLKWMFPMPHFGLESTPIVVDGVMYLSGNNQAYAIDAVTGNQIWKYSRPPSSGLVGDASVGTNRGVAVLGDKIFLVTDNAHLLALNRVTGGLIWEVVMPEQPEHYGSTVSPLIVQDTVIAGVSGGDWGMRGFVVCYKAATGELVWRHWTLPAKDGDPGRNTWGKEPPLLGGGSTWLTGTYDKETDTVYWPTGNPWPDRDDRDRPGDNLYTDSILALNPRTGELKWYFQFTPHDTADRDANEPPVLIDTEYRGKPRKLLLHADRNGFFYVLDRTNGEMLLAKSFLHRVNWATGIGEDGRPLLAVHPPTASNRDRSCPNNAANWSSTAFSPTTRLYYFMTLEDCHEISQAGDRPMKPGQRYLRAIHIDSGELAWELPQTGEVMLKTWPGVLATEGGLLFYGDPNGAFVAADQRKGKTLWHFDTNVGMKASPMTYAVGGRQFVAVAAGSAFLCFGLP